MDKFWLPVPSDWAKFSFNFPLGEGFPALDCLEHHGIKARVPVKGRVHNLIHISKQAVVLVANFSAAAHWKWITFFRPASTSRDAGAAGAGALRAEKNAGQGEPAGVYVVDGFRRQPV